MNELIGIYANEVRPKLQLASAHSLYLAVHRCRDMVHVTNDRHSIQVCVCVCGLEKNIIKKKVSQRKICCNLNNRVRMRHNKKCEKLIVGIQIDLQLLQKFFVLLNKSNGS